jgi:SnoaL-like domain
LVAGERRDHPPHLRRGLIDKDPEWLLEPATPDIEYVNPPFAVEPGVRHGPVEVLRAMRAFAEVWEKSRHKLHELFDRGDIVVAAVSWYTRSRGSESELVQEEAHGWMSATYYQLYTDERDVQRVYEMSPGDGVWKLWRDGEPFSQRFTGIFSEDGNTIAGRWEIAEGGKRGRRTST